MYSFRRIRVFVIVRHNHECEDERQGHGESAHDGCHRHARGRVESIYDPHGDHERAVADHQPFQRVVDPFAMAEVERHQRLPYRQGQEPAIINSVEDKDLTRPVEDNVVTAAE